MQGGLLAHREELGGGEAQGTEGGPLGGPNGRRSSAGGLGARHWCARNAWGCLHLFGQVGPMSARLDLQLSTARAGERSERRGGGLGTLATSAQDPSCNASARLRPQSPAPRDPSLLSTHCGGAPRAGRPAPTGCPRPCSPTLASWCFWEVGAPVPPTGSPPKFGREGARRRAFLGRSAGTAVGACARGGRCCAPRALPRPPRPAPAAPPGSFRALRPRVPCYRASCSPLRTAVLCAVGALTPGACRAPRGIPTSRKMWEDPRPTETPMGSYKPQIPPIWAAGSGLAH